MLGFMLTLAAALSWACGNIFNKKSCSIHRVRPLCRWWYGAR
ncbi:Permease of the drug/metabolite transporter (DMT) superfamily [Citrobacter freundii]|uniref:Permease of the drug/metabolite transporter (DMT) superfamily n=1 Tax=Citrobacter freundii TaxID=546 RepID=A0A7G2IZJ1_CITFR|nr:Permease of the drug/metabolite transporter (DMT) superfamily [Citrobacter freundii]